MPYGGNQQPMIAAKTGETSSTISKIDQTRKNLLVIAGKRSKKQKNLLVAADNIPPINTNGGVLLVLDPPLNETNACLDRAWRGLSAAA